MQVTAKHKDVYFSISCEGPKIDIAAKIFEGYCHGQTQMIELSFSGLNDSGKGLTFY